MSFQGLILLLVAVCAGFLFVGCDQQQLMLAEVVERIVTVEVEKIVTVEVEKVITATLQPQTSLSDLALVGDDTTAGLSGISNKTTLEIVRERGYLICGGNVNVPGFGYLNPVTYEFQGFDIDFCKALAAAIFGDPTKMEIRPITAFDRFEVLASGEIDILIRNTTWTASRDIEHTVDFLPTTFYDGQGVLARKRHGFITLDDLDGRTVCVQNGSTSYDNLVEVTSALEVNITPLALNDVSGLLIAYEDGSCDAYTADKSSLVSQQILLETPGDHAFLDVTLSKEPLGPAVRNDDRQWYDIVKWVIFGTFQAEELGIHSQNIGEALISDNPLFQSLLGLNGTLGQDLGLKRDFMVDVIEQVGNYGEIYERHLGQNTVFNVPRGLNAQWKDGGLLYSPPFQ